MKPSSIALAIAATGFALPALAQKPEVEAEEVPVEAPGSAAPSTSAPPPPAAATPAIGPGGGQEGASEDTAIRDPRKGLVFGGYVQGQYERHADSEDQLRPGGLPNNQNRFLVRRARLKVEREWSWSSLMLEIDGNNTNGPEIRIQHAEASLLYRGSNPIELPPMVRVTLGFFDVPFGYELVESPRVRPFVERSVASRAFFPNEPDFGLRISGALSWFRYSFAVINGEPTGNGNRFGGRDPNNAKDWVAHVGAVAQPTKDSEIAFGASFYNGTGFSPGTDPTKGSVIWKDLNENKQIENGELSGSAGQPGVSSESFDRWMVGADLQIRLKTKLGWTRLFGEAYVASDMDRGLYVANPGGKGLHTRELGYVAGFIQDIGTRFLVGFRTDFYDPNADYLEKQGAHQLTAKQSIRTYSPMIAWLADPKARLVFQYDATRDHFGRTETAQVNDLKNDTWTLRLQVEL